MKTEVYTWRLSADRKTALEEEARREGTSLSMLLDRVTADWLAQRRNGHSDEDGEQAEIRNRARAAIGSIQGDNSTRSERTSELVREIIAFKHKKESRALARRFRKTSRRATGQAAGRTH
jgi:hypothetical protein